MLFQKPYMDSQDVHPPDHCRIVIDIEHQLLLEGRLQSCSDDVLVEVVNPI